MLIDNILMLRERFPAIRNYFSVHEEKLSLAPFKVSDSRSGTETIRYQPSEERVVMIHSIYDPIQEAERIIASHENKIEEKTHVFFYGIGMGYHIERFLELFPNQSYSLYEPIPEVFLRMTNHRKLKNIINKNLRNLYIDHHDSKTLSYLEEFTSSNQKIHLIVFPSYKNIIPEKYEQFHKNIKETIRSRRTNLRTDAGFQKLWVMNSLINFETVLNTPNMLKDIRRSHFEGKPALIVSAGPSLAEDIEHIRYIKENNLAYIFSVGSAINSLIEFDVMPDAVFTYDPTQKNKKVFEKMIDKKIEHIPMVFGSSVGYETIENYNGPKVHFITSQDRASFYFIKEHLEVEYVVLDSPSIAVMTFQILNKLGADPIIFAGQNLGYLHDRLYSEGIKYDYHTPEFIQKRLENTINIKDVYGNDIKTNVVFNAMRNSIEKFVKHYQGTTFINTTKGGAKIEGVPFQSIEEVIEHTLTHSINKIPWWAEENSYNSESISSKFEDLNRSMKEFTTLLSSLEILMDSISIQVKIRNESKALNDLTNFDKLYNRLIKNIYYNQFLSFFIRIHVKFLENEIKRLNTETNVLIKAEEIVSLFTIFLGHCKRANLELAYLLENNIVK